MTEDNRQEKQNKPPRSLQQVRKDMEQKLRQARIKERDGKLEAIVKEILDTRSILSAKERKMEEIAEEYADVYEA